MGQFAGKVTVVTVGPAATTVVAKRVAPVEVAFPPSPLPPAGGPQGSRGVVQLAGGPCWMAGQGGRVSVRVVGPADPGTVTTVGGILTLGEGMKVQPGNTPS